MSKKCKIGFWKWLLVKSPIDALKGLRDEIVNDRYGFVAGTGGITAIMGVVFIQEFFGPFLVVIGFSIAAYGYYRCVCEKGEE